MTPDFATIDWRGRPVRIECHWIAPERTDAPLIVFLHEGLGSVAMWKDFPADRRTRCCPHCSLR
jgi:hypothetical protein